ncbi:MAG: SAM-dependent methyltransferase [Clostridia bacterium]|nr:SAM-dependent methyltransferase [Clostridia bacterium]
MNGKKVFGDYQTPYDFAQKVCKLINCKYQRPLTVLEPTCGIGSFLKASLQFNAQIYYGIEINPLYCNQCKLQFIDERIKIINADIFNCDLKSLLHDANEILVIGNPPWVTNSDLSKQNATNAPHKANIKALNGFDAITGASNFDICEYIILQMIELIKEKKSTLAMLCKTSVARNIFKELNRCNINYNSFSIYKFNAQKVFNIGAAACLLVIEFNYSENDIQTPCNVYDFENFENPIERLNYSNGEILNLSLLDDIFNGKSCFEWRQGIKHDCSKVMELSYNGSCFINGNNEIVDIEKEYVFPLIKGSMFKQAVINVVSKYVIVTQTKIKEDTQPIKNIAPKTWQYLYKHLENFEKRKSSIYKNSPLFSMFGIGDYSFAKYKVGISGFYKRPFFALLDGSKKPIMTDDTSYFINFDNHDMAYIAMLCLNNKKVKKYLMQISFQDAKRPYTKQILNNLDFEKIVNAISFNDIIQTETELELQHYAQMSMYNDFKCYVKEKSGT